MAATHAQLDWITDSTAEGKPIAFPLLRIRGGTSGPVLGVIAGNHGGEYCGIDAATRLVEVFAPEELSGQVLVVPCAQVSGLQSRTMFASPQDGKQLSQAFPGDPAGGYTSRLAHLIYRNLILPSDALIELRGGELVERMAHYVSAQITPDEAQNERARAAAQVFGARNIIYRAVRETMGERESAYTSAVFSGKLALLAEAGSNGLRDPRDVSFLTDGILNVAAHLGMIDRSHAPVDPGQSRIIESFVDVRSPAEGLFEPMVDADEGVTKGQLIGRVYDFDRNILADIVSPEVGIVLGIVTAYGVVEGATVIGIGKQR